MPHDQDRAVDLAELIAGDIEQFLTETMRDPDIARRSDEFKDGYRKGFTEASVAFVAKLSRTVRPQQLQ